MCFVCHDKDGPGAGISATRFTSSFLLPFPLRHIVVLEMGRFEWLHGLLNLLLNRSRKVHDVTFV